MLMNGPVLYRHGIVVCPLQEVSASHHYFKSTQGDQSIIHRIDHPHKTLIKNNKLNPYLSVVELTVNVDLSLSNVTRQIGNWMGNIWRKKRNEWLPPAYNIPDWLANSLFNYAVETPIVSKRVGFAFSSSQPQPQSLVPRTSRNYCVGFLSISNPVTRGKNVERRRKLLSVVNLNIVLSLVSGLWLLPWL